MKTSIPLILLCGSLVVSGSAAELPKQSSIFTVYEFLPEPNYSNQWAQDTTGVVVCKDKQAFFWSTRAAYQELQDRYRKSPVWVPPPIYSYGYGHKAAISLPEPQQKIPTPQDVFCIKVFPGQEVYISHQNLCLLPCRKSPRSVPRNKNSTRTGPRVSSAECLCSPMAV